MARRKKSSTNKYRNSSDATRRGEQCGQRSKPRSPDDQGRKATGTGPAAGSSAPKRRATRGPGVRMSKSEPSLIHSFDAICLFTFSMSSILLSRTQSDLNIRVKFTENDNIPSSPPFKDLPVPKDEASVKSEQLDLNNCTQGLVSFSTCTEEKRSSGESEIPIEMSVNSNILATNTMEGSQANRKNGSTKSNSPVSSHDKIANNLLTAEYADKLGTEKTENEQMEEGYEEIGPKKIELFEKSCSNIQFIGKEDIVQLDHENHIAVSEPDQRLYIEAPQSVNEQIRNNVIRQSSIVNEVSETAITMPPDGVSSLKMQVNQDVDTWSPLSSLLEPEITPFADSLIGPAVRWLGRVAWKMLSGEDQKQTKVVPPAKIPNRASPDGRLLTPDQTW